MRWEEVPYYTRSRILGLLSACYDSFTRQGSSTLPIIFMAEEMIKRYNIDHCFIHEELKRIRECLRETSHKKTNGFSTIIESSTLGCQVSNIKD